MVPLADHHWSRASASCRARCSPYWRSAVLRASQLPALLTLRQPTHPFPPHSSASSPSAFFSYFFLFFIFTHVRFFRFHVFFSVTFLCVQISFFTVVHRVFRASPCVDHIRFRFGRSRDVPSRDIFIFFIRVLAHLYIFCCIVAVW